MNELFIAYLVIVGIVITVGIYFSCGHSNTKTDHRKRRGGTWPSF